VAKRLAITISGAVSLGSYEAGVLYELVRAIASHNNTATDANRIVIDVLTGASAGAITAALTAQKLLYDADALASENSNALYLPWVRDVDIDPLLSTGPSEKPELSLLSSDFISELAKRYLLGRYLASGTPTPNPHPACAGRIRLGIALSNLNGVDYKLPTRPVGSFNYTRNLDDLRADFTGSAEDTFERWQIVTAAAIASGAFPFAFRVQELHRSKGEYTDEAIVPPAIGNIWTFAYTDGGVFQNEPLGLAKKLVDGIDHQLDEANRFYLFVSPGGRGPTVNSNLIAAKADFVTLAKQLGAAVLNQAQFGDWIRAEKVNQRVAGLDAFARGLAAALMASPGAGEAMLPVLRLMVAQRFKPESSDDQQSADATRLRLRQQYSVETGNVAGQGGANDASAFVEALLLVESTAKLEESGPMRIYAITSTDSELASAPLHAFQGFIDQAYRQHDYDLGRQKVRDFIQSLALENDPLGPISYAEANVPITINRSLDGLKMSGIPTKKREQVRDKLHKRIMAAMKDEHLNIIERKGIDWLVLNGLLNKMFEL